jgi:general secretion pathway protein G
MQRTERESRAEEGFTLLELLIVIAVLGLLAALGATQLSGYLGRARTDTAQLQIDQLSTALDLFRIDVGRLPTTEEGLNALLEAPAAASRWRGPYLKKRDAIIDPWGRPFNYRRPGERGEYDLVSFGADNRKGGTGEDLDVSNLQSMR